MMMLRKTLIWWTLNPLYFVGHWCAKGIKTYKRYTMHKGIVSWCACVSHHRKALIVFEYTSMLLDSSALEHHQQLQQADLHQCLLNMPLCNSCISA
uniref:Uncharacterized protein LOC8280413 n=1 Tax=Rhizophora mucronata TaxID=61149 RepID=A0A2P2M193_RHIMU